MKIKQEEIIDYWKDKIEISIPWNKAHNHCWACGIKPEMTLERSHIFPKVLGGRDESFNLILLCPICNATNPETIYTDDYWLWFKGRVMIKKIFNASCCGTLDFCDEYELMYNARLRKIIKLLSCYMEVSDFYNNLFGFFKDNKDKYFPRYLSSSVIMFHKFVEKTMKEIDFKQLVKLPYDKEKVKILLKIFD